MNCGIEIDRFFIDISYNGTNYHGWQKQTNSNTIQQTIENVFKIILKKEISIYASGRTDTGVHAKQQIAHLDLPNTIDIKLLKYKLNKLLPFDISINNISKVEKKSHARFDAKLRTYEYIITQKKDPFYHNYSLLYTRELNLNKMNEACDILLKKSDFKSFCKSKSDVNNYRCLIKHALWEQIGHRLIFTISANRFLRGMVRAIVGTLLKIGSEEINIEKFEKIIDSEDRRRAKNISPKGLILKKIEF